MNGDKNVNINSVKSLYISIFFDEIELGSATGFLVKNNKDYYLVTNRHVVTGRNNETGECMNNKAAIPNKLKVWLPYKIDKGYAWNNREINLYDLDNKHIWLEHPLYKEKVDVIAIKINNYKQDYFCYNLLNNYKPIVTENIFIIGYPFGFKIDQKNGKYAIWTSGIVASDPDLDLNINEEQLPAFLIDSKTRQGQSGSPVIYYSDTGMLRNDNGFGIYGIPISIEIGIYSGRINKESDLGYVWKWSLIREIVDSYEDRKEQ